MTNFYQYKNIFRENNINIIGTYNDIYYYKENGSYNTKHLVKYLNSFAYLFCKNIGDYIIVGIKDDKRDKKLYVSSNNNKEYISKIYNMIINDENEFVDIFNYISEECKEIIFKRLNNLYEKYPIFLQPIMNKKLSSIKNIKKIKKILLDIGLIEMEKSIKEPLRSELNKLRNYSIGIIKILKKVRSFHWKNYELVYITEKDTCYISSEEEELNSDEKEELNECFTIQS